MAIPADLSVRPMGRPNDMIEAMRGEQVKIVAMLRVLTAKLDADAGVTDTNYAALVTAADAASPAKVLTVF